MDATVVHKSCCKCQLLLSVCFWFLLTFPFMSNYKVEEDEVGGTCGTNGGEEERV
jgi:hypothetical protein